MHNSPFRFPGVLNSKDLLIAEAVKARAWDALASTDAIPPTEIEQAKAKLGRIVVQLMAAGGAPQGNLADDAVRAFMEGTGVQAGDAAGTPLA